MTRHQYEEWGRDRGDMGGRIFMEGLGIEGGCMDVRMGHRIDGSVLTVTSTSPWRVHASCAV